MDRSALLKLIHKDINELQLLLEGMEGYAEVPEPIIKLAKSKADQLKANIDTLPGEILVPVVEPESLKDEEEVKEVEEEKPEDEEQLSRHTAQNELETLLREEVQEKVPEPEVVQEDTPAVEEPLTKALEVEKPVPEQKSEMEQVREEPVKITEEKVVTKKKTVTVLGETISSGEKVIDKIKKDISGSLGARIEGSPIHDLTKSININDRFMFQKELFGNDRTLFNDSLVALNNLNSFDDALGYIIKHFEWDFEDETTGRFVALVNRRYK